MEENQCFTDNKIMFRYDFYRMTGEMFKGSLRNYIQMIKGHNLRYMWWWRRQGSPLWSKLAKIQLYRYSRKYGLEIGNVKIGKGLYLGHPYNITVNEDAILGENVNLHKGVTIGRENRGKRIGAPIIGNRVFVGVNATVVGHITIGDDVMIAPNSFVNFDVPLHSIVMGNPAVIYPKYDATWSYINFLV